MRTVAAALITVATPVSASIVTSLSLRGGALAAEPLQLISQQGEFNTAVAEQAATVPTSGAPLLVVASVGGKLRGRRLLNALFDTSFRTQLQPGDSSSSTGAWVAASPSVPGLVLVDTEQTGIDDECALAAFCCAVADAVLVHTPCVSPSPAVLRDAYEKLFVQHLSIRGSTPVAPEAKTMLVHVHHQEGDAAALQKAATKACEVAWEAATASTELKGTPLGSLFHLEHVALPSATFDAERFDVTVADLRTKLRSLHTDGLGKATAPSAFGSLASSAWDAAQAVGSSRPSVQLLQDRLAVATAFDQASSVTHAELSKMAEQVASDRVLAHFGRDVDALLTKAAAVYDNRVIDCSPVSVDLVSRQRERMLKSVQTEARELFVKQHRLLTLETLGMYKNQMLKVMARAGTAEQFVQDRLRRNAEKVFDARVAGLIVAALDGPTRSELTEAFSKQLTQVATKFVDSPAMQLQALGAMRRRVSKGGKPPTGINYGLGLVGALRTQWGGGQGNLQSFVGYTAGLNSAHLMLANDGAIPDSSGVEPPLFRWQPKLNFDIAL